MDQTNLYAQSGFLKLDHNPNWGHKLPKNLPIAQSIEKVLCPVLLTSSPRFNNMIRNKQIMEFTEMIEGKKSKIESSLRELFSEISTATRYLLQLKENSAAVVKNLNNISKPSTFLLEFMNVNSFLLKSITFLTEINCKFEMLDISDKWMRNLILNTQTVLSEICDESGGHSNCESLEEVVSKGNNNKVSKNVIVEKPSEVCVAQTSMKGKKSKKKKSKKFQPKECENKVNNGGNCVQIATSISEDNKNSKINSTDNNGSCNHSNSSHTTKAKQKSNSVEQTSLAVSAAAKNTDQVLSAAAKNTDKMLSASAKNTDQMLSAAAKNTDKVLSAAAKNTDKVLPAAAKNTDQVLSATAKNTDQVLSAEKCVTKETDYENLSRSSTLSATDQNNQGKKQTGISDLPEDNKNPAKVSCNTVHTSGDIPVAEVVPTKVWDWWSNSKVPLDFHSNRNLEGDNSTAGQLKFEKEDEEEEDDIKSVKLLRKLDEEYDVVIEHIKSPSEFYVSLIDTEGGLIKEMEEKLRLISVNKNDASDRKGKYTKAMLSSEIGKYALVYLKCDEICCRAKITNWGLNYNDNFVNVFLLDYGVSKCVSIDDLQPMPEYFKQYPTFIVRCHLHDVFPVDMDMGNHTISWGRESSEKMKSLTENSNSVRIKVAPNDHFHPSVSLPVTLWLVDQDNQCVNNLLVTTRYAIHGPKIKKSETGSDKLETCNIENDFLNNWNPMKEDFQSYQNSYDLDINDPSAIIYGYVGKDYDRICRHFAKTGYCFKGDSCRKEHKKFDSLGFTTDQEEVYQNAFFNLPVPTPKSILNVQVTCLLNYNKFFCFLETHKSSSDEEDLQSLLKNMNKKENILKMKPLLIPPSPGQIVIARYSEDEAWYRARILESQPEDDKYTVVFVDYGNKETKPLSQIRAIEAQYLHLPFQAVQCLIYGIEQNPEVPLKKVMDYMKNLMVDGHICIEVIARLPGEHINLLVNVFGKNGQNIGEDLMAKEYAFSKKEMIINSCSESLPG